jgi:tetratricopeptide (TPR) repeat protein
VNYALALLRAGRTAEAIAELERAQRDDPSIPHTWFNLGIVFKKQGEHERALAQFEQMVRRVPDDAISRYNLGYLYELTGKSEKALAEFEQAARLDPSFAAPRFQLYNAYRLASPPRTADADRALARFQEIKRQQAGAAVPEDVDWSVYAEILDVPDPENAREESGSPPAALAFDVRPLAVRAAPETPDSS